MRVYFDASILIAAFLSSSGGSALLFTLIKEKVIVGISSETVIKEVREEDKATKLKRSRAEMEQFVAVSGLFIRKEITQEEIAPYHGMVDREDAHLIAGARLTKCPYLVTLDKKHLLRADIKQAFLPLRLVSPKELLEEIII